MDKITVVKDNALQGWKFTVYLSNETSTKHVVSMNQEQFDALREGKHVMPEYVIEKSFEFLLEREPKESILSEFDISVISKYFPDFEEKIKKKI